MMQCMGRDGSGQAQVTVSDSVMMCKGRLIDKLQVSEVT